MTTVDVWLAACEADWDDGALATVVSDDERARAAAFHRDCDRRSYLAAHVLLRHALTARRPHIAPDGWRFATEPSGRPVLANDHSRQTFFSLSHCSKMVGCAVSEAVRVGFDLESMSRGVSDDLADRYFAPIERQCLAAASLDERRRLFFRYWTLKEAYLKARGLGLLAEGIARVSFEPIDHRSMRALFWENWEDDPAKWSFMA